MRCPSVKSFKPACSTAVMCTNTSRPPSSGLMKPYPRSPLKNLTVPLMAILQTPSPRNASPPIPHGAVARPNILDRKKASASEASHSADPPKLEAERLSQQLQARPNSIAVERGERYKKRY